MNTLYLAEKLAHFKNLDDRVRIKADVLDHQLNGMLKFGKVAHHIVRIE